LLVLGIIVKEHAGEKHYVSLHGEEEGDRSEKIQLLEEIRSCVTRLFRVSSLVREAAPVDSFDSPATAILDHDASLLRLNHITPAFSDPRPTLDEEQPPGERLGSNVEGMSVEENKPTEKKYTDQGWIPTFLPRKLIDSLNFSVRPGLPDGEPKQVRINAADVPPPRFRKGELVHMPPVLQEGGQRTKGVFTIHYQRFNRKGGFIEYQLKDFNTRKVDAAWKRERYLKPGS
jgi:hypothetical protein